MEWEYLSDEELDQLVKEIEAEPLCRAPEYLKPMILNKAKAYDRSGYKLSAGTQLFIYSIKIMAAAAAAMIVILTVPVMDKAQSLDYMEQSAQVEVERMRDRAADWEQAQLQDRIENMDRVNRRHAVEEELEALTRRGWGDLFFTRGRQDFDGSEEEGTGGFGNGILEWFRETIQ